MKEKKGVGKTEAVGGRDLPRLTDPKNRLCISVTEVAGMLGISRNYAYELVKEHQIPVVKFGKRLLIPRVQLERILEKGWENEGTH